MDHVSLLVTWKPQQTSNFSGKVTLHTSLSKTFAKSHKFTLDNLHDWADKISLQSAADNQVPRSTIKPGGKTKSPSTRKRDHARLLVWKARKHQVKAQGSQPVT